MSTVLTFKRAAQKRPWCQRCRGTRRAYDPATDCMVLCPLCNSRGPAPMSGRHADHLPGDVLPMRAAA